MTDTDFDLGASAATASITGGTGGSLSFLFQGDTQNREFGDGFEIASFPLVDSASFDETEESDVAAVGSLTITAGIGLGGFTETAGFSATVELVPEPAGSVLGVAALLTLAVVRRARSSSSDAAVAA